MFQNVVKVQYYLNPIKDNLHCMEMTKLYIYCYVESIMAEHSHLDNIRAVTCDFKQYGILTSVNSNLLCSLPLSLETPNGVQSVAQLAKALIRLRVCAG